MVSKLFKSHRFTFSAIIATEGCSTFRFRFCFLDFHFLRKAIFFSARRSNRRRIQIELFRLCMSNARLYPLFHTILSKLLLVFSFLVNLSLLDKRLRSTQRSRQASTSKPHKQPSQKQYRQYSFLAHPFKHDPLKVFDTLLRGVVWPVLLSN